MMRGEDNQAILTLSCPDRPGIVAAVSGFLADCGCNILESSQFDDLQTCRFFLRIQFDLGASASLDEVRTGFLPLARRMEMEHQILDATERPNLLIMVSKFDHCLADLLYRYASGSLFAALPVIVSNHETARPLAERYGIPYVHLPVSKENKAAQEKVLMDLVEEFNIDLVVLARYMQVLSAEAVDLLNGRVINIHHSFLPGFKGAKPYHRAYERGVKLIGATAHFVTADLDEGPIIAQDVLAVDHKDTPSDLIVKGRDVEARVLATAVRAWTERRVLLNGQKTVVFS